MKRRALLKLLLSAVGLGAAARFLYLSANPRSMLQEIVRNKLHFLEIDPKALEDFSSIYLKLPEADRLRGLALLYRLRRWSGDGGAVDSDKALVALGDQLAERFLLSTDFFGGAGRASRVERYVGLYDPYTGICSNPFANRTLQR